MTLPDPHLVLIGQWTLTIIVTWPKVYRSTQESQWNKFLGQHHWISHLSSPDSLPYLQHKQDPNTIMAHKSETGHIRRCCRCLIWSIFLVASPHAGYFLAVPYVNVSWHERKSSYPTTEEEHNIVSYDVMRDSTTVEYPSQNYSENMNGYQFVIFLYLPPRQGYCYTCCSCSSTRHYSSVGVQEQHHPLMN